MFWKKDVLDRDERIRQLERDLSSVRNKLDDQEQKSAELSAVVRERDAQLLHLHDLLNFLPLFAKSITETQSSLAALSSSMMAEKSQAVAGQQLSH